MSRTLRLPALEITQGQNRKLYAFAVDGKLIPSFATVSRIKREEDSGDLVGYQRPEQLAHIEEIRTYLESESPLLPNAVVIAFDETVRFEPSLGPSSPTSRTGELLIPIDRSLAEHERPGFIVDGQQRIAAIREAQVDAFPVCAVGFIASSLSEQTEQFILVNSTKPLPKGLIYELLPSTEALLPTALDRRRLPAILMTMLNRREDSPLYGAIKTATNPTGRIKDNSILRMIENSASDGVLFTFRAKSALEEPDLEGMYRVVSDFFSAVRDVWTEAWELPPKRSRLTHGAGIAALGFLMDTIAHRIGLRTPPTRAQFRADLSAVAPFCCWTSGFWNFGPGATRKWNELQNTPRDTELLVKYLAAVYREELVHGATRVRVSTGRSTV